MSEILFRFIPGEGDDDRVEWCRTPLDAGTVYSGTLSELARAAAGQRCVLAADGGDLHIASTSVPSRQRSTILRAVPYLLEDQLADDIEGLHFAIGERDAEGVVPVVVVRHSTMESWRTRCVEAGIHLHAAVAEPLLIPHWEGEWTVAGDDRRLVVRKDAQTGFVIDKKHWALLLAMHSKDDPEKEKTVHVLGGLRAEEAVSNGGGRALKVEDAGAELLPLMAMEYERSRPINLLQGAYSSKAKVGKLLRPWTAAMGLLVALVATQFAANLFHQHRLSSEVDRLNAFMEAVYRQTFPGSQNVVNPKLQMERQLESLRKRAGSGAGGFLEYLSRSGPVLRSASGLKLTGMNYRDGALTLNVSANSLETVDELRERLMAEAALAVEIQSASSRDGKVNSRLLIRKGST